MERSENADILGQPIQHVPPGPTSSKFTVTTAILVLGFIVVCYTIGMRIRREILIWRENAYKLETRRRHGIPDNDRRPFNVAYAAAMLRREQQEKDKKGLLRRPPSKPAESQTTATTDSRDSHADQGPRNRFRSSTSVAFPGAFVTPSYIPNTGTSHLRTLDDPALPPPTRSAINDQRRSSAGYQTKPLTRHAAARNFVDLTSDGEPSKRGLDDDWEDSETLKKTRTEGEQRIDGDEDPSGSKRAGKRTLVYEDEDEAEGIRDKRARKVSLEKNGRILSDYEEMDVDEELDEVPDMVSPVRGKKRDRAEAGSTFGGDDDESEQEDDTKSRKNRRKRRNKRKSDIGTSVGRKRDRDVAYEDEEMGSPSEAGTQPRHHKKGRRRSQAHHDYDYYNGSDISVDDSLASTSTRGRRRRIGEEWESNGIRWKIGPNGQRLRQALVKKARSKFPMPRDSVHPDRNANLEVFVETWLTEEEYNEAKEQSLLAWQDSPKQSVEPENISVEIPSKQSTPAKPVGKSLLWQSTTTTPTSTPITGSPLDSPHDGQIVRPKGVRNPGRYSLGASTTGGRINPFERPSSLSIKRIASSTTPLTTSLSDKTNSYIRPRNLSKWEKQEVEAQAMAQLRALKQAELDKAEKEKAEKERQEKERLEKETQEKERLEKERQEKERLEKERKEKEAAAAAAAPKVPAITVTAPSSTSTPAPAPSGFSFGAPKTNGSAPAAPASGPAPSSLFGAPSTSAPSTTTAKPEEKKSGSLFEFKAPAAPASSGTSTAAPASSTPFSFGAPSSTTSGSTATPSPFGAPAVKTEEKKDQPAGGSLFGRIGPAGDASKPAETTNSATSGGFSFGKPAGGATGSVFGQPSSGTASSTPAAPSTTSTTTGTTAPKFSFGAPAASTPSTTASGGTDAAKSGTTSGGSLFSFKPSTTPAPSTTTDASKAPASGTSATAPKFSFGAPSGGSSAFGSGATSTTSGSTPAFGSGAGTTGTGSVFGSNSTTQAKSAFGSTTAPAASPFGSTGAFGGASSNPSSATVNSSNTGTAASSSAAPSSAFGQPSSTSGTSAFGQPSSTFSFGNASQDKGKESTVKSGFGGFGSATSGSGSVFGNAGLSSGSAFGSGGSKPATNGTTTTEAPKFSFGAPATGSTSTTGTAGAGTETPKPTFSFGAPAAGSTSTTGTAGAGTETPKPTFSFGGATTTPAGAPPAPSSSAPTFSFGATTTPSSGTGTGSGSVFGATSTPTASTPSLFGATKPVSAFGFGTPTTTAGSGTSGAAGTTTPAGTPAFTFGKK
ncbi:hypothetical protein CC1G_08166 [Coprinopsis cinerea okayama7|uniref:Uncharacterized protein n=1 Tax=Coprinopsis cinerea (strain Okayama-7 / 130 / ATCC MYA-4618 / FGSC 9003) TaxID=240176 RepID=A8NZ60_COPC7|nr:hypothetical protein CC1G_08166 [Coprinopsis cinerea okayama7\|eukprot:XP_001837612.2 hypothetical protein CC1G_08166 [Coprinopsis cinerea okayama7\